MANRECLDCHATGLDVRYDRATRMWTTEFADAGVACEDCHGPGARHADTTASGRHRPSRSRRRKELGARRCARSATDRAIRCFPLLDADHRFRPGERYDDFYDPVVVLDRRQHSGDFFADGRPKTSSFEYQAMLQSACYRKGGATCLTCHTAPHEPHGGASELRAPGADELPRLPRGGVRGRAGAHAPQARRRSRASRCHMPPVVVGRARQVRRSRDRRAGAGEHEPPRRARRVRDVPRDVPRAVAGAA